MIRESDGLTVYLSFAFHKPYVLADMFTQCVCLFIRRQEMNKDQTVS